MQQKNWREQKITLPPNQITDVHFNDTKPNYIHVNSFSDAELYIGVNVLPSKEKYENYVAPRDQTLYARLNGTTKLQIYNDSAKEAMVLVTSFEGMFDPNVLSTQGSVAIKGGEGAYDGYIRGFGTALPAGDNNIGRVSVSEIPSIEVKPLPEGDKVIGKVEVTNPNQVHIESANINVDNVGLQEGDKHVGKVTVSKTVSPAMSVAFDNGVDTTPVTVDCGDDGINTIVFISNDSLDNDLLVYFDEQLQSTAVRMRPNEILSDVKRNCKKIHFVRLTGTGSVRFMGV
ncbi:hypothetical protein OCA23_30265 [Bacillus cereus]|nr:hypothetical protein [Bacillus cereus]